MQPSQEIASCKRSRHTLAGAHLGSAAPVPWPWAPAAVAAPASFLKDVRTLQTSLAGHNEVNTPFTGLREKTQTLATLRASMQSVQHQGLNKIRVLFYLFLMEKKMVSSISHGSARFVIWKEHENYFLYL